MNQQASDPERAPEPRIHWAQIGLLCLFCLYAASVIVWILHLIRLSFELHDKSSLSVGISIVAIPMFITLTVVVNYVFWGMLLNQKEEPSDPTHGGQPK
jgi:uncharacterized membrane protein YcjF (UPF0283 family)